VSHGAGESTILFFEVGKNSKYFLFSLCKGQQENYDNYFSE
jgi:hypothetical protein